MRERSAFVTFLKPSPFFFFHNKCLSFSSKPLIQIGSHVCSLNSHKPLGVLGYFFNGGFLYDMGQAQSPQALVHLSLRLESQVLKGWGTVAGHSSRIPVFCVASAPSASGSDQSKPLHRSLLSLCPMDRVCWYRVAGGPNYQKSPLGGQSGCSKTHSRAPVPITEQKAQLSPPAARKRVHFPELRV